MDQPLATVHLVELIIYLNQGYALEMDAQAINIQIKAMFAKIVPRPARLAKIIRTLV